MSSDPPYAATAGSTPETALSSLVRLILSVALVTVVTGIGLVVFFALVGALGHGL